MSTSASTNGGSYHAPSEVVQNSRRLRYDGTVASVNTNQFKNRPKPNATMQRPQRKLLAGVQTHIGPLLLFAFLAIVWTWPLVVHLREAIPGGPGDNYSFLWNLWWMRRALADKDLSFFWTDYLFFPFGTSLTDHPHTALAALVAATVLKAFSLPTAQNTLLLASVFGNMAAMYALTWDVTHHRRAAVFGAMVF